MGPPGAERGKAPDSQPATSPDGSLDLFRLALGWFRSLYHLTPGIVGPVQCRLSRVVPPDLVLFLKAQMKKLHPGVPWGCPLHFAEGLDGAVAEREVEAEEHVGTDGGNGPLRREQRSVSPDVRYPPLMGAGTPDLVLHRQVAGSTRCATLIGSLR